MSGRRAVRSAESMNRLYVVELTPSLAGTRADHRLPLASNRIVELARTVATRLGAASGDGVPPSIPGVPSNWLDALVSDLQASAGRSVVFVGASQPGEVHALAHAMNTKLGNIGQTVNCIEPVEARPTDQIDSIHRLTEQMRSDQVRWLLILGGNPVYNAPADLDFAVRCASQAGGSFIGALRRNIVSLPLAHPRGPLSRIVGRPARLRWHGEHRAQPLIAPMYGGRTAAEMLSLLTRAGYRSAHELVQTTWRKRFSEKDFSEAWQRSLHDGVVANTAAPPVSVDTSRLGNFDLDSLLPIDNHVDSDLEVVFRADECVGDGRFSNNGWLQELPKPLTKIVWDNAALISPGTAERLGLAKNDNIEIEVDGRSVTAPIWILPGQADGVVTLPLGYGRTRAGNAGNGLGFNAYRMRGHNGMWRAKIARWRKLSQPAADVVDTQNHWSMDGREIIRETTFDELRRDPEHAVDEAAKVAPWRFAHPRVGVFGTCLGHDDRSNGLHRLQRLRSRVRCGEQHADRWQVTSGVGARDELAAYRSLLERLAGEPAHQFSADDVRPLRLRRVNWCARSAPLYTTARG